MTPVHVTLAATSIEPTAPILSEAGVRESTLIGHPTGLFVLFFVEMWERFSYYGMRALLVLYLTTSMTGDNPGRGWSKESASNLYGWYAGMAYLLPILGGILSDKLIGAHRSMLVGGILITLGHVALAVSGMGTLGATPTGISVFVLGLALIVIGTGHFKPNVSVMVGRLYKDGDPRRDSAFTIFYMGINIGAFVCAFVCGTLGEKVGWHWGFGAAAIGMLIGLIIYLVARPKFLVGIGEPPSPAKGQWVYVLGLLGLLLAALVALAFHSNAFGAIGAALNRFDATRVGHAFLLTVQWSLLATLVIAPVWFVRIQSPSDRGPVAAILIFIIFNAIFWLGFEQAGTSLNLFGAELTERHIGSWEMPATWFQSIGALLVILLAPAFAALWSALDRRQMNPSQPIKMAIGLFLLGGGYAFMVVGSLGTTPVARASMVWLVATYFMHTLGELCISPTGLSFVTRAAPVRFLSFLMGLSFLSNSLANWAGGRIAGQIDHIAAGEIRLPWSGWFMDGGQASFFFLFVVATFGAGMLVLAMAPLLKRMLGIRA
jgi:proton-dependent oligopeptide transporter, POT family